MLFNYAVGEVLLMKFGVSCEVSLRSHSIPDEARKGPAFERLLLPKYIGFAVL